MSKEFKLTLVKSLLVILVYFFYQDIISIPLTMLNIDLTHADSLTNTAVNVYYIACHVVYVIAIFFLYKDSFKEDMKDLKTHKGQRLKQGIIYILISIVVFSLASGIVSSLGATQYSNNDTILEGITKLPAYTFMLVVICLPIIEQITFKKTVKDVIDNKWMFIIFSSLLYGFFNVAFTATAPLDYLIMIPYILQSIILCSLYYKTNNITQLILMLTSYNFIVFVLNALFP